MTSISKYLNEQGFAREKREGRGGKGVPFIHCQISYYLYLYYFFLVVLLKETMLYRIGSTRVRETFVAFVWRVVGVE